MSTDLLFFPASNRNKEPILEALTEVFARHGVTSGTVLEIGAGSGQHVVHFARELSHLTWLPTDRQIELGPRVAIEGGSNILPPIKLDVTRPWPEFDDQLTGGSPIVAAYSANTAHIMSWAGVCATIDGIAHLLPPQGVFCLYGPFTVGGVFNAPSNEAFDRQLRSQDPQMGIRDQNEIAARAAEHKMILDQDIAMPANNQLLVFIKQEV